MGAPYRFELAGYCEGCPYFCAEQDSMKYSSLGDDDKKTLHVIRCHNRDACARVAIVVNQVII